MKIFKILNYILKKQVAFIIFSLVMAVLTISFNVGLLSTSSILISRAALHTEVLDLMVLIVGVRFFGIFRGVFRYLERLISHDTTFRLLSSLRKWVYKQFNAGYSENNKSFKTGEIYTKIVNDVDSLKEFYLRAVYPSITAILTGIVMTIFISYFNKFLSCIYILFYFFCGFIVPAIFYNFNKKLIVKEKELKKEQNLLLLNTINGIVELSIYSLKEEDTLEFNAISHRLSKIQKEKNFITIIGENVYSFTLTILIGLTLYLNAEMVSKEALPGIYYAMMPLGIIASFEALIPMSNVIYKFAEAINSTKSVLTVTGCYSKKIVSDKKIIHGYDISMEKINISDIEEKDHIIKDFTLELPFGKKVAIVGASGSGKTTLLKALLGFMKYQSGNIKIGGSSFEELEMDEIRKYFTYIPQNPYVFNTTIKENLLIANPKADKGRILNSLDKANLLDLIKESEKGLETPIGQYGVNISGGEKQRLAIARALLKESKIVLLDEPTASLDVETEKRVIGFLHSELKDKSCIWVTHRLVEMNKMDEIIVLHKGEIVERGTHKELVHKEGRYYKLWSLQKQYITN